jgi:hypothetical protein
MKQYKLGKAAEKNRPAPYQVHMAIFNKPVFCSINHVFNQLQAFFRRKLRFAIFHIGN